MTDERRTGVVPMSAERYVGEIVEAFEEARGGPLAAVRDSYQVSRAMTEAKRRIGEHALEAQRGVRTRAMAEMHQGAEEIEALRQLPASAANADLLADFAEDMKLGLAGDLAKTSAAVTKRIADIAERDITPEARAWAASHPVEAQEIRLTLVERLAGRAVRWK